jgi:hypothetical protein
VCISWKNKEFGIINARCNHEDYQTLQFIIYKIHYLHEVTTCFSPVMGLSSGETDTEQAKESTTFT